MLLQHACLLFLTVAMLRCFTGIYPDPAGLLGAAGPAQEMNFTVEGKINRLGQNKFTINSEENMVFHVRYDDKTEIKRQDGNSGSAKDLRVGLKVKVDGDLTESGEIVAHRIIIESSEPPKKPSQSGDSRGVREDA
jgi:hypothetical protein